MIALAPFAGLVGDCAAGWQDRRFIQGLKVIERPPHGGEGLRGRIGIGEGCDPRLVKDSFAGLDNFAPHPTCEYWLAGNLGGLCQGLGNCGGVSHGLGGENCQ